MTDPNQRRMNWQIKTDTGKVKQILDNMRPDMLKHYEAAVASLCEMETKARQTLNAAGVHTIFYVPYLNYARQLYKLSRRQGISGESFALSAQVPLDKWSARGGDTSATRSSRRSVDVSPLAVLARIRTEVFDAAAPTPQAVGHQPRVASCKLSRAPSPPCSPRSRPKPSAWPSGNRSCTFEAWCRNELKPDAAVLPV